VTYAGLRETTGAEHLFATAAQAAALAWGDAPLQFTVSETFRRTLGVDDIEGWLDCSLLHHPFFKVFLADQQVPIRFVASPRTVGGQVVTGYIDGEKTRSAFAEGATLMLCNMHEWHAPCRQLCRSLAETLVADVRATAFYSPAGCRGLPTHRDDAHVFVAQLSGEKRWSVFDLPSDPRSRRVGRAEPGDCGHERLIGLRPGDGLYLPPYAAHHAYALPTSNSLHLSIAVREPVGRDVVDIAMNEILAEEAQRAEISGNTAARAAQVGDILRSMAERLIGLDPAELVAAIEKRVTGG
jgi:ribosomal protein L16 Arg81 hydroxylase